MPIDGDGRWLAVGPLVLNWFGALGHCPSAYEAETTERYGRIAQGGEKTDVNVRKLLVVCLDAYAPDARQMKPSVERHRLELERAFSGNPMVVFLCGPSLKIDTPGARLRGKLKEMLEKDQFEVVLGEDDGLEDLRAKFKGIYAHINELEFLRGQCGAIVLIADSVGAYCELGLFAYEHTGEDNRGRDFILIVANKYEGKASYLNEGPARAVADHGALYYVDLETFDGQAVLKRLQGRRATFIVEKRGRPSKK
jgi:hypothetical protein